MNKFVNFLKINIPSKKIAYFLIITVAIFLFSRFVYFQNHSYMKIQNFYDLIISIFNNQLVIAYFLFISYLIFIYNIGGKKEFNKYILTKFRNVKQWYNNSILTIVIFSVLFVTLIVIVCFLESCLTLNFRNNWSEYSILLSFKDVPVIIFNPSVLKYVISLITPLEYILINIIYFVFFLCNIGMIFFILSIIFKNKIWAFISIFLINCINILAYNSEKTFIRKFSLYNNLILLGEKGLNFTNKLFYTPLIYWAFLSIIVYFIGKTIVCNIDFKFGDDL